MQMLYDQSKVPQQCTSKLVCVMGIAEVAQRLDDHNLSWSHCSSKVKVKASFNEEVRRLSVELQCPAASPGPAWKAIGCPTSPRLYRRL